MKKKFDGFLLVEVGIFLIIIGILSSIFFPTLKFLKNQVDIQKRDKIFDEIYFALQAFYSVNGRLPYASVDFLGNESLNNFVGFIPYKTISLQNNCLEKFSYIVSKKMAEKSLWSTISETESEKKSSNEINEIRIFSYGSSVVNLKNDSVAFAIIYGFDKNNFNKENLFINEDNLHNRNNLMWKSENNFKIRSK